MAYAAIAYETVARAVTAEAYLKNQAVLLDDHLKTESYNLRVWIKNQYDAAKSRIEAEGRRVGLLTDEVAELQVRELAGTNKIERGVSKTCLSR